MAHKLTMHLDVFSSSPLYLQLALHVKNGIEEGRLRHGEKLPSIREFARQLQVSQMTVREAMNKLSEWNLIIARPGSGNYVNAVAHSTKANPGTPETHPQSSGDNHKSQLSGNLLYDFRSSTYATDFMGGADWKRIVSSCASSLGAATYSHAAGLPELRQALAECLNKIHKLDCDPADIFITTGALQCRDLSASLLLNDGSKVVVEEPCSITDILPYLSRGANLIQVEQDEYGMITEKLEMLEGVKLAHIASIANFPGTATLPLERRQEILDWARRNQTVVIEDACNAGLHYEEQTASIYQLAKEQGLADHVIYHGSFAELLMPSMCIGFAILPKWLSKLYFRAKWLNDRHPSVITQTLLLELFRDDFLNKHLPNLRATASERRTKLLAELASWPADLITYRAATAGSHQAICFNNKLAADDILVVERAGEKGVGVIPLSPNFHKQDKKHGLLLNFMGVHKNQIADGLELLLSVILDCRGTLL